MSNNPHPIGCCCWKDDWPNPTLEISYASDGGLLAFGSGYSGINLFVEESWGNNPEFFYQDLFGPDKIGSITRSGAPANDFLSCIGECESYIYEHKNNFVEDASEYAEPYDKCWDWKEFTVAFDHNNVTCATSQFNPAIQIPSNSDPDLMVPNPARICECGNWDTRTYTREVICGFRTGNVVTPPNPTYCPPLVYADVPVSGKNWCGGSVFDINAPNIIRDFKKAFIDDGEIGRDPQDLQFGDYFPIGGLGPVPVPSLVHRQRSKRDHRKNWRNAKLRASFVVPPTCYFKVWSKVKITTLNCSANSCFPDTVISEATYDLDPVEWIGTSENCYGQSGYPHSGNIQTVDIINSLSKNEADLVFAFFDENAGGNVGEIAAPTEPLGVTCGHRKTLIIAFKYSMIPNYEPEWGCLTGSIEQPEGSGEYVEACSVYDIFDLAGAPPAGSPCVNTNGLPTPLCHYV